MLTLKSSKLALLFPLLLLFLLYSNLSFAQTRFYGFTTVAEIGTGISRFDGNLLSHGDAGFLILADSEDICIYVLDATANQVTSSETPCPVYIRPVTNPGTKTWKKLSVSAESFKSTIVDNPHIHFSSLTSGESQWYIGPNHDGVGDDNDPIEIRQSVTPGSSVWFSLTPDGTLTSDLKTNVTLSSLSPITVTGFSGVYVNVDDDVKTFNLGDVEAGRYFCFRNRYNRALTITPSAGDIIWLSGSALTAGQSIVSTGAANELMCILGIDNDYWMTMEQIGTWSAVP